MADEGTLEAMAAMGAEAAISEGRGATPTPKAMRDIRSWPRPARGDLLGIVADVENEARAIKHAVRLLNRVPPEWRAMVAGGAYRLASAAMDAAVPEEQLKIGRALAATMVKLDEETLPRVYGRLVAAIKAVNASAETRDTDVPVVNETEFLKP